MSYHSDIVFTSCYEMQGIHGPDLSHKTGAGPLSNALLFIAEGRFNVQGKLPFGTNIIIT
jgi:hypothetical protein